MTPPRTWLTRREFLRLSALSGGSALLGACGPRIITPSGPAASPTAPPAPPTAPAQISEKTLRLTVHWSATELESFSGLVDEWNQGPGKTNGVTVNVERIRAAELNEAEWTAAYVADYVAGTPEDIYHMSGAVFPELVRRGFFAPPPQEIQDYIRNNYVQALVDYVTYDGVVWGYPTELQASVLWINTAPFQALTLDPDPAKAPRSWDELRELARALTEYSGQQKVKAGYIWQNNFPEPHFVNRVIMHAAEGEPFIDMATGKNNLNSAIGYRIMEHWHRLAIENDATTAGMTDFWEAYANDLGRMIELDAWFAWYNVVALGGQELLDQTIVTLQPTSSGENHRSSARGYFFTVSAGSQGPDEAWEFLRFMNEKPETRVVRWMTQTLGFLPSHLEIGMPEWYTPNMRETFAKALEVAEPMPFLPGMAEAYAIVVKAEDDVAFGLKEPQQAADDGAAELQALIDQKLAG